MTQHPRVGVAALISRRPEDRSHFVIGIRKGSHGAETWAPPGGHLENGETFFAYAERETLEETGLRVNAKRLVAVTNDLIPDKGLVKHYVTIYILCDLQDADAEPEVKEPNKCEAWKWVPWKDVRVWSMNQPSEGTGEKSEAAPKLFLPMVNLLDAYPELEQSLREPSPDGEKSSPRFIKRRLVALDL